MNSIFATFLVVHQLFLQSFPHFQQYDLGRKEHTTTQPLTSSMTGNSLGFSLNSSQPVSATQRRQAVPPMIFSVGYSGAYIEVPPVELVKMIHKITSFCHS